MPGPVAKLALIGAPVVALYSPTVPLLKFATKRWSPDRKSPAGPSSPGMKLALITAPVLALYSPTMPLKSLVTKRRLPHRKSPAGASSPRDEVGVNHGSRRSVVFANCGAAED